MKVKNKIFKTLGSFMDHAMINKSSVITDRAILTDIDSAIERCTNLQDTLFDEKYVHEILFLVSNAPGSMTFLSRRISARLESTREPVKAIKSLLLIHRLLRGGDRYFEKDFRNLWLSHDLIIDPSWLLDYHDETYAFVHAYSLFLEERIGWAINQSGNLEPIRPTCMELGFQSYNDEFGEILSFRVSKCQKLLERVMDCFPVNLSSYNSSVAQSAFGMILRESFQVYEGFKEGFESLNRSSFEVINKPLRALVQEILNKACIQTPQIQEFYQKCKKSDVSKGLDYPLVKIITPNHVSPIEKTNEDSSLEKEDDNSCNLFSGKLETTISTVWVKFDEKI
ncbi:hypothetical protein LUZ60_007642 [Juncus effusus]|nr:hypothetical protein LUZ60_007642 [Juncus effusus]